MDVARRLRNAVCYWEVPRPAMAGLGMTSLLLAPGEAVAAVVPVLLTNSCEIAPVIHKRAGLAVRAEVEDLRQGGTNSRNRGALRATLKKLDSGLNRE